VAGGLSFTSISTDGPAVCGVAAGGRLYCWGRMGAVASRTPKAMAEGIAFRSVDVGDRFYCGVATDGRVFCQGKNASGELGDGTKAGGKDYAPVPLSGGLRFASVSAGSRHACGVTMEGAAWCWGANLTGQLGVAPSATPSYVPVAVDGGLRFRSVSAGYDYTCGVTTTDEAYCWGVNQYGQLGDGSTTTASRPVRVGTLMASSIVTGMSHTCALATDGRVFCWGRNAYGELGDGTRTPRRTPAPVAGGTRFVSVSVAMPRTCALGTDGQGYCWGANPFGAHGDGTTEARLVPTKVAGWPR